MVFWPRRWETGPNVRALVEGPFQRGGDEFTFRFGMLMAHDRDYKTNERRVRFGGYMMKSAIAFFVLSLVSLGIDVLRYDERMSTPDLDPTEYPASQSDPGQGAGSDQVQAKALAQIRLYLHCQMWSPFDRRTRSAGRTTISKPVPFAMTSRAGSGIVQELDDWSGRYWGSPQERPSNISLRLADFASRLRSVKWVDIRVRRGQTVGA